MVGMKALLVDANNVLMRSLKALQYAGLTSDDGVPTGAVLGFINALSKHVREEKPDKVVLCWDGGVSEYRRNLDAGYKAHRAHVENDEMRTSAFSLAKEFAALAGIPMLERQGFEADDLVADLAMRTSADDLSVILSSDKDFFQLLESGRVEQVRLTTADKPQDRWTEEKVMVEHLCTPDAFAYALAMAGDTSDNVIGLNRVGIVTAVKKMTAVGGPVEDAFYTVLIEQYPTEARRIAVNHALVDLRHPLPGMHLPTLEQIPDVHAMTHPGSPSAKSLVDFLDRYQLVRIKERYVVGALWTDS